MEYRDYNSPEDEDDRDIDLSDLTFEDLYEPEQANDYFEELFRGEDLEYRGSRDG